LPFEEGFPVRCINPDIPRSERPTATPRAMLDTFKKTEKKE
jgi:hypothetical protein